MTVRQIDTYLRNIFDIDGFASTDYSLNGLQVGDETREVTKVAFAVDACREVYLRAVEAGAHMLFVHHGIFWGRPFAFTGSDYERIKILTDNDLALYAVHLPLDMHPELGNNIGIMRTFEIETPEPFGNYRGKKIGYKGRLPRPLGIDEIIRRLGITKEDVLSILPFGSSEISTIGVVSGGGLRELSEAVEEGLDLYITGDAGHTAYHTALENRINMISAGHYATETFGVRLTSEKLAKETELETVFIDVPTGL